MGKSVKKMVGFLEKSKQPQCKSFKTLKSSVHNKFTEIKLEFFNLIAG